MDRKITHTNSGCRIEVLHYMSNDLTDPINEAEHNILMDVEHITIIDEVTQCSMSKSIGAVRGTFDLMLMPTENWKQRIRPGDWLVIYLSIDGNEAPRMLGNVDRVARSIQVGVDGKKIIRYKISGSDFGKVFDKYDIYFNAFSPDDITFDTYIQEKQLRFQGPPWQILNDILEIFLGNGADTAEKKYQQLVQWFIPNKLTQFFPAPNPNKSPIGLKFFDLLQTQIEQVGGFKNWDNGHSLQGNLWNMLQRSSNTVLNELFVELKKTPGKTEYRPTLTLRTIPFTSADYTFLPGIDPNKVTRFKRLPTVTITTNEVLQEDLGQNDHAKFNYFVLWSQAAQIDGKSITEPLSSAGEPKFPRLLPGSIRRNGLMVKADTTDFAWLATENNGGSNKAEGSTEILRAWNDLIAHWYTKEHLYETGTMVVVGNPEIELGKRIVIQDKAFGERDRAYYIESYSDSWEFPERWTTTLSLTRGQDAESEEPLLDTENPKTAQIGITHIKNGFSRNRRGNN